MQELRPDVCVRVGMKWGLLFAALGVLAAFLLLVLLGAQVLVTVSSGLTVRASFHLIIRYAPAPGGPGPIAFPFIVVDSARFPASLSKQTECKNVNKYLVPPIPGYFHSPRESMRQLSSRSVAVHEPGARPK